MATKRITELDVESNVKDDANVIITQTTSGGNHYVKRASISSIKSVLLNKGVASTSYVDQQNQALSEDLSNISDIVTNGFSNANNDIAELKAYIGYTDTDIFGVEIDYKTGEITRLAGARTDILQQASQGAGALELLRGLEQAQSNSISFFDDKAPWKLRRCIMALNGVILAYHGDEAYTENGFLLQDVTVGDYTYKEGCPCQVMVEIPPFFVKRVDLEPEILRNDDFVTESNQRLGDQMSSAKVRYYISSVPKDGFWSMGIFDAWDRGVVRPAYIPAFEPTVFDVETNSFVDPESLENTLAITSRWTPTHILFSAAGKKPLLSTHVPFGTKTSMDAGYLTEDDYPYIQNEIPQYILNTFDIEEFVPRDRVLETFCAYNPGLVIKNSNDANLPSVPAQVIELSYEDYQSPLFAVQLLALIEYASFDVQSCIGTGINTEGSSLILTGGTSSLGNSSGIGQNGSVSYRGIENLWGHYPAVHTLSGMGNWYSHPGFISRFSMDTDKFTPVQTEGTSISPVGDVALVDLPSRFDENNEVTVYPLILHGGRNYQHNNTEADAVTLSSTVSGTITFAGYGQVSFEVYPQYARQSALNFIYLAKNGCFNGVMIDRLQAGVTLEMGKYLQRYRLARMPDFDYTIKGEFSSNNVNNPLSIVEGSLVWSRDSMDPDSAKNEFMICLDTARCQGMAGSYAPFGQITSGMSIVQQIASDLAGTTDAYGRPSTAVTILSVVISGNDTYPEPNFIRDPNEHNGNGLWYMFHVGSPQLVPFTIRPGYVAIADNNSSAFDEDTTGTGGNIPNLLQ